jgi:hypothetical protein
MSPVASPRVAHTPWWKLIDWRLVAAVGLPLWAFVFGLLVPLKTHTVVTAAPPENAPAVAAPDDDSIPPPREIRYRDRDPDTVTVPVIVPVPVAGEPVAAKPVEPEFQLPDTELVGPPNRCKTFDTKVKFHPGPAEATAEAKKTKKLLLVLHISGNFEDPGFT